VKETVVSVSWGLGVLYVDSCVLDGLSELGPHQVPVLEPLDS